VPRKTWDLMRWNRASIRLGTTIWLLAALGALRGWLALDLLGILLLLALFVVTPLALGLVALREDFQADSPLDRLVVLLQPVAALIAGASFLPRTGLTAGALAAGWFGYTTLAALKGLRGLVHARDIAEVCLAMALVYLPIGGAWFVLARLGAQPLGFGHTIVALTAVHFHFVPLAELVVTGLTGRQMGGAPRSVRLAYRVAAVGMLASPPLVAAGQTVTQVTEMHLLETTAALLLPLSLLLVAVLGLAFVVPATDPPLARALLAVSGASVVGAMLFASASALGAATGAWSISISTMVATHGVLNALGFGLCGLLGWRLRQDHV
jgi:hypothetical protein